ncbi:intraflagellar transport protein 81 homolog [Fopius arisanus]|uniref:Intraflagellar transport protein 81 homolog n=2 Tax=Fopius arisanus TaxID=64838 RepID=A0A9R1T6T7_9HYME|nr:PREDICTED: intraflagellar transport protein 81 homolog [Fopius arisanus]
MKMNEDLKFIISELNKIFKKIHTLISFKSVQSGELLQILSDVLSDVTETPKVDMRDESLDLSAVRILTILRVLKYQPTKEPALFRQRLVKGDQETIYEVLKWLFANKEIVKQRAYLSKFLVKVEVPAEWLADPETAALYERYENLVEDFKMVHKEREAGRKSGEAAAELKADLKAMEKEREVILDRLEKIKVRTASNSHLLKAANALRIERDRDHELSLQRVQEKEAISNLQVSLERAERKLRLLQEAGVELSPQVLEQRLSEEVMLLTAVKNERLPTELVTLKSRVEALNSVANTYVGPDDIIKLRQKLDVVAREVQALAEIKVSESGTDQMAPFRQQAAAIAGVKRNTLERLEKTEQNFEELVDKLEEKKEKSKRIGQDSVPKGEDLKRYVTRLKTKSVLYKKCRTELSGLRAEAGVLSRTLAIIEGKLAKIKTREEDKEDIAREGSLPEGYSENNAENINKELKKNLMSFKVKLAPLLNELQPLRVKAQDLDERYERAQRSHESVEASVKGTVSSLSEEVKTCQENVDKDGVELVKLRDEISKLRLAQERIQQEMRLYASHSGGPSFRDKLNESIIGEEKKSKQLKEEEKVVRELVEQNEYQTQQWNHLIAIFECKLHHMRESKKRDGIVVRKEGTETLILQ